MDGHNMTFDICRNVSFMFGGYGYDFRSPPIFEFNGVDWRVISPTGDWPQSRAHYGLTYDSVREVVVLFGGFQGNFDYLGDTWEWDGTHWEQKFPEHSPSDRTGHSMTYDEARQKVVLFGGSDESYGRRNDTWIWDGVDWVEVDTIHAPSPRTSSGMVFSDSLHACILYGGTENGSSTGGKNDTWEFDGYDWNELQVERRPPSLYLHIMVYDKLRDVSIIFSGIPAGGGWMDETWEFDGSEWYQVPVSHHPCGRGSSAACYDLIRQRVVLFGGWADNGPRRDTWEYYDVPPATATPVATMTPVASATPTGVPFRTPTPSPEPTCFQAGVTLEMPSHAFHPGAECYPTAILCNTGDAMEQIPFFCVLEYCGTYWYYPGWTEGITWKILERIPSGETRHFVIEPFTWPSGTGEGTGFRFLSAITDPGMSEVIGDISVWEFGWRE